MGNCFNQCGAKSKSIILDNEKRAIGTSLLDDSLDNKKPSKLGLMDFHKLKLLGKGAVGVVLLVEMRKTSF